ncbi:MAG: RDD family protein [Janthinobacterium lividum]
MNPFERPESGVPGAQQTSPDPFVPAQPAATAPHTDSAGFARRGFADQLSIETPEQVALMFPVAGIGSRSVALLLDHLVQFGVVVVVGLILAVIAAAMGTHTTQSLASKWFIAGVIFLGFLLFWGYFALFEAFWRGQTPGKRVMNLRVIKDAGRQITLFESLARNLLRVADYLPSFYLAGAVTMLCNKRNKRLGDLAAGTIVVHERAEAQPLFHGGSSATRLFPPTAFPPTNRDFAEPWRAVTPAAPMFAADALQRLSGHDLVVMEAFFGRALDLPLETRAAMAYRIAGEMTAKMGVGMPEGNPERVIEVIAVALRAQGRRF